MEINCASIYLMISIMARKHTYTVSKWNTSAIECDRMCICTVLCRHFRCTFLSPPTCLRGCVWISLFSCKLRADKLRPPPPQTFWSKNVKREKAAVLFKEHRKNSCSHVSSRSLTRKANVCLKTPYPTLSLNCFVKKKKKAKQRKLS